MVNASKLKASIKAEILVLLNIINPTTGLHVQTLLQDNHTHPVATYCLGYHQKTWFLHPLK
jgi:hypothetical protein